MRQLTVILADYLGLWRICGAWVANRWLLSIVANLRSVMREGNLQAADRLLGAGPFHIRFGAVKHAFVIRAESAISGIREMYVRDCYLKSDALEIKDGDVVLDLGANVGNFTNLALAHGQMFG